MTSTQIYALIFLVFNAAFLYWTGYKTGLADGRKHQHGASTRRKAG